MYNRIKSFKFCHFMICGLAVLCCTLLPSSASAVDIAPNAQPIWTNATPNCTFYQYQEGLTFYNEFYNNQSTFRSIYSISCAVPAGLQSKNTYAVYSFTLDNIPDDNSLDSGFRGVKSRHGSGGDGGWGVIGYTIQSLGSNSAKVDVYLFGEKTNTTAGTVILFNEYNSAELLYLQPKERVSVSGASYWQVTTAGDFEYNYTDLITAINNKLTTTNSTLNNINNNSITIRDTVNGISTKIDDLVDAQEQANQDAQDRYDAEKQEESDREDSISDSSDDAQGLFSFTVLNPFSGIFNLFNNDCSANIPIIASWLHAPSSTYTSWWCPIESEYGIRSYLTPVFGIASMMLLFGFVVRWLSNNSGDIYGARNFNKEMNG